MPTTKHLLLSLSMLTAAAIAPCLQADEGAPGPGWKVEVDLGLINTSGNTETTSLQGKIDARQTLEKWENQYILSTLFKEDQVTKDDGSKSKEKTAEKHFGSLKSAYLIGVEKSYLFGYVSYTDDKFGAYRTYTTVAMGYGDWLYSTPKLQWFVEAGPGYFEGKKPDADNPGSYTIESGAILRAATELIWKFSSNAEFKQLLSVESGSDNTRTISESSVAASLTNAMKMKVGVNIANDTDVAPGKKKTDTTTFVNLVYSF